jgi:hypothetical protein
MESSANPTEETILENAIHKNALAALESADKKSLLALIRYARNIGYSEGWKEYRRLNPEGAKGGN